MGGLAFESGRSTRLDLALEDALLQIQLLQSELNFVVLGASLFHPVLDGGDDRVKRGAQLHELLRPTLVSSRQATSFYLPLLCSLALLAHVEESVLFWALLKLSLHPPLELADGVASVLVEHHLGHVNALSLTQTLVLQGQVLLEEPAVFFVDFRHLV